MSNSSTLCKVGFDQLKVPCIIGVRPWERLQEQELIVDVRVGVHIDDLGTSDSLASTVDYGVLAEGVTTLIQEGKFRLLETLTVQLLDWTIDRFKIPWAWVRVQKPSALSGDVVPIVEFEKWNRQ